MDTRQTEKNPSNKHMNKRLLTLFKWHISSHRERSWQRVVAACEGDETESEGKVWRYCDLSRVETILTVAELGRYLASEYPHHWEKHDESSGFARIDDIPTLPPEDEAAEASDCACTMGKCPCCFHTARSRDCWCSWQS
jgi:hypothetical protein